MNRHHDNKLIGPTERFIPGNYTAVVEEISLINEKTDSIPIHFKQEIIISFMKDHSLRNKWIDANPELIKLVTSQSLFTGAIESLFDSCRNNPVFRQDLEAYLKNKLTG